MLIRKVSLFFCVAPCLMTCLFTSFVSAEETDFKGYKQELIEIENRLDRKIQLLDEKIKRLEELQYPQNLKTLDSQQKINDVVVNDDSKKTTLNNDQNEENLKSILPSKVQYGKNGFEFETEDNKYSLAIQNRIQFRYADPFDTDPRTENDLDRDQSSFLVRRARTKMKGHAYSPWLKYNFQYDWAQPVLRDLNLVVDKYKWATFWVGRGKVKYNDERVASSADQQFVNRSIVNDVFTVDRQQGLQLYGNLFPNTFHDLTYYTGVFTGVGIGERNNDDNNLMYSGRLQWNALGGEMDFKQSDVENRAKPALNFAIAAATNRSKCTAFETDSRSCRDLEGFEPGEDGQYRINQFAEEVRFKWQGFSLQHEIHWKEIEDTLKISSDPTQKINLRGGFFQVGYFFHNLISLFPPNLELSSRYALVDPNRDQENDRQQESSAVATYYLNGRLNKINFQVSHLTIDDDSEERYWLQWDLTF